MTTSFVVERRNRVRRAAKVAADLESLSSFLRSLYPHDTAINIAGDIGVSERTIDNWLAGLSAPRLCHFLRLVDAYGPTVLAAAYPSAPGWLDEAVRADERQRLSEQAAEIAARLEALK